MKATPPARALAWAVEFLDRSWSPLDLAAAVALVTLVFAPRGMVEAMIGAGIVSAAFVVTWLGGGAGYRPH